MSEYLKSLKLGTSSCFFGAYSFENFKALADAGIDCVELSGPNKFYNAEGRFCDPSAFEADSERIAVDAERAGIELWSLHLPFARTYDISSLIDDYRVPAMETNLPLIRAAGKIGVKVAVLHPSSEPITDEERPARLKLSRENILRTVEVCEKAGMTLAVENLPRTCLCRTAEEMMALLDGTGASAVFDTNHSLKESNPEFLSALAEKVKIASLHISDYDFIDERHRLPGDGINDWTAILGILEKAGYSGPLMYEVPRKPKEREPIPLEQLAENMKQLRAGCIK